MIFRPCEDLQDLEGRHVESMVPIQKSRDFLSVTFQVISKTSPDPKKYNSLAPRHMFQLQKHSKMSETTRKSPKTSEFFPEAAATEKSAAAIRPPVEAGRG